MLVLKDFLEILYLTLSEDSGFQILDHATTAHFRLGPNKKILLGGDPWTGDWDDLLKRPITSLDCQDKEILIYIS